MNSRIVTLIVGIVTLGLGLAGLLYPDRIMGVLGFTSASTSRPAAVLGEVRATYGGLFVVLGVYTLLAAREAWARRGRLVFIGLLWLGACGGRLLGVYLDGNPGLPGWAAVAFEFVMGGALVVASTRTPRAPAQVAPTMPRSTPPSPPS